MQEQVKPALKDTFSKEEIENAIVVQTAHLPVHKRIAARLAITAIVFSGTVSTAFAAVPTIDTSDLLSYIGVLVAAVSTVGAAVLMVFMAAKGVKAIRTAF